MPKLNVCTLSNIRVASNTAARHQTALDDASAIRVCQPGLVAFQRANVSGGNRREIDVRALRSAIITEIYQVLAIGKSRWPRVP
jgi:hypothetical protein